MMTVIDQLYLFIFGVMVFSSVLWILVYVRNRKKILHDPELSEYPSVTFLIPAYNEEEYIEESIESLLNQDYPSDKLDVVAINDGSTDSTLEKMKKYSDRITIIDKENSGKAASMNYALETVDAGIVGCLDGDSFAEPGMVESLVSYYLEHDVKGVTPAMKVRSPETWVQKIIWAEYVYQIFLRKLFSIFDSQYVMPGPGSIYDTETLKEIGGWDENTLTEDMEIAFRMVKEGHKLENSTNAYVDTISPASLKGLYAQRVRWYRGYINNFMKYREFLFNTKYGNLGVFMMPFNVIWTVLVIFVLSHFVFNLITTIFDLVRVYMLVGIMPPSLGLTVQSFTMFHIFYLWFTVIGITTLFLSVKTAGEEIELRKRKTHYILYLWVYTFLYAGFWIAAVVEEIIQGERKW